MKDKHIHNANDTALLKKISKNVQDQLHIDPQKAAVLIVMKFIFYFSLTAVCYCLLFTLSDPLFFIIGYICFGIVSLLFAFNFSHDFSHNTIFKSKKLNHICFTIIYSLVGAHAEAWKKRHVESHHYAPNVADYDSDLQISGLIRVIPGSEYRWYHKYQYLYASFAYTTYSLFWVFVKDFVILFSKNHDKTKRTCSYYLSFSLQKIFYLSYLLLLPLLFSKQHPAMVFAGFLLMHMIQSLFLLFTFFMTHHVETTAYPTTDEHGFINTSWLMNQIKSSNDMHPFSPLANFILGGFNNHIAHHLFPHVHHIHYPALSRILYRTLRQHGIEPNQTSYTGGIFSHLKLLKKMSVLGITFLILFASCRKPDKVLIRKDGEWTMYIREVRTDDDHKSETHYDTLTVRFDTRSTGLYKKINSTDTFADSTWNYYVSRNFFDYGKRIEINIIPFLSERNYEIKTCKKDYEQWDGIDSEFMSDYKIRTYVDLTKN